MAKRTLKGNQPAVTQATQSEPQIIAPQVGDDNMVELEFDIRNVQPPIKVELLGWFFVFSAAGINHVSGTDLTKLAEQSPEDVSHQLGKLRQLQPFRVEEHGCQQIEGDSHSLWLQKLDELDELAASKIS